MVFSFNVTGSFAGDIIRVVSSVRYIACLVNYKLITSLRLLDTVLT